MAAQGSEDFLFEIKDRGRGFFAGFNAWLVVGIDAYKAAVKAYCTLVKGDELTYALWRNLWDANRDGLTIFFKKGIACAKEEAL